MSNQKDVPFETDSDRAVELDELNFEDDESTSADLIFDAQIDDDNNPAMPGDDPTDDDLSPETLIKEDGARSAHEFGEEVPADQDLSIVDEDEIGGGSGLDEAELARKKPLDGKPWGGNPDQKI